VFAALATKTEHSADKSTCLLSACRLPDHGRSSPSSYPCPTSNHGIRCLLPEPRLLFLLFILELGKWESTLTFLLLDSIHSILQGRDTWSRPPLIEHARSTRSYRQEANRPRNCTPECIDGRGPPSRISRAVSSFLELHSLGRRSNMATLAEPASNGRFHNILPSGSSLPRLCRSCSEPSFPVQISLSVDGDQAPNFHFPNRRILLDAQNPSVVIGRASKTPSKGFLAEPDNAWFNSEVMSRQHAEIKADFDHMVCHTSSPVLGSHS